MNDYAMASPPVRGGMKFKHILILLLIAFVGGAVGAGWLAQRLGYWDGSFSAQSATAMPAVNAVPAPAPSLTSSVPPADTVAGIESRLTQINADAAAASGNAARAEGLLVAFAARRALDSGAPLGYLADQLRLRFGTSQPQAVATILSAEQSPVTLEALQVELIGLEHNLINGDRDAGIWATVRREMSELFVLRREGAPSPAPTQRMLRARTFVEAGNINGAIVEVSAMPGAASAQAWLAKARRYLQARKALDRLERSALIAPPLAPSAPPVVNEEPIPASPLE